MDPPPGLAEETDGASGGPSPAQILWGPPEGPASLRYYEDLLS